MEWFSAIGLRVMGQSGKAFECGNRGDSGFRGVEHCCESPRSAFRPAKERICKSGDRQA